MTFKNGFSLIELMITLSISSILVSYAVPTFRDLKLNNIMDSERNRLTSSLQYARNHAISFQHNTIICPSQSKVTCDSKSDWHKGWIIFVDRNNDRKLDDNEQLLLVGDAMQVEVNAISSIYRQKIKYNIMGFSPGTNLSINFCDERGKSHAKSIILNNAGRIKQSAPISNKICT